eukprot:1382141-Pleurochrysis_carterae.AAC.1
MAKKPNIIVTLKRSGVCVVHKITSPVIRPTAPTNINKASYPRSLNCVGSRCPKRARLTRGAEKASGSGRAPSPSIYLT